MERTKVPLSGIMKDGPKYFSSLRPRKLAPKHVVRKALSFCRSFQSTMARAKKNPLFPANSFQSFDLPSILNYVTYVWNVFVPYCTINISIPSDSIKYAFFLFTFLFYHFYFISVLSTSSSDFFSRVLISFWCRNFSWGSSRDACCNGNWCVQRSCILRQLETRSPSFISITSGFIHHIPSPGFISLPLLSLGCDCST